MTLTKVSKKIRDEIASDLKLFAEVLRRKKFNVSAVNRINEGAKLLSNYDYIPEIHIKNKQNEWILQRNTAVWEYQITDLEIDLSDVDNFRHMKPNKIEALTVSLTVICKAHCEGWQKQESDVNPFIEASVKAQVFGYKDDKCFQTGFHFDLCKPSELSSDFSHPSYHLQYSPEANSDEDEFNHGNILLMETPRIIHPPLDFILGFDYILSNFAPHRHQALLEDNTYNSLVHKYQDKIWKPYYRRLSSFWDTREEKTHDDLWHPQNLLPHLRDR